MFLLEGTALISGGPAWFMALSAVATFLTVVVKLYFPYIGKKYDYAKCQKDCAAMKLAFEEFKEQVKKEKEAKHLELSSIKKKWRQDGDRLIRAETLMRALKIALNEQGYDDFIHLLEEIVSKDAE